jgi:hypothetical protein
LSDGLGLFSLWFAFDKPFGSHHGVAHKQDVGFKLCHFSREADSLKKIVFIDSPVVVFVVERKSEAKADSWGEACKPIDADFSLLLGDEFGVR